MSSCGRQELGTGQFRIQKAEIRMQRSGGRDRDIQGERDRVEGRDEVRRQNVEMARKGERARGIRWRTADSPEFRNQKPEFRIAGGTAEHLNAAVPDLRGLGELGGIALAPFGLEAWAATQSPDLGLSRATRASGISASTRPLSQSSDSARSMASFQMTA